MKTTYHIGKVRISEFEKTGYPAIEHWPGWFASPRELVEYTIRRIINKYWQNGIKRIVVTFNKGVSRLDVSFWDKDALVIRVEADVFKETNFDEDDIKMFDDIVKVR